MPKALVGAGGFLAGVLWMHLLFDFQALGHDGPLPAEALAGVVAHYRHVSAADPWNNVAVLVMMLAVLGAVVQLARGAIPLWLRISAVALALMPLLYLLTVIDPAASRLGSASLSPAAASDLASQVARGHLVCFAAVVLFTALELIAAHRLPPRPAAAP